MRWIGSPRHPMERCCSLTPTFGSGATGSASGSRPTMFDHGSCKAEGSPEAGPKGELVYRPKRRTIGDYNQLALTDAREAARHVISEMLADTDPWAERRKHDAAALKQGVTMREIL